MTLPQTICRMTLKYNLTFRKRVLKKTRSFFSLCSKMPGDKEFESFDTEVDAEAHKKLVENVLNLSSRQQIKKPTRTEPISQISEFSVVKSGTGNKGAVHVKDLTRVLKLRSKHVQIEKKVRSLGRKTTTLPKPLEKPQMERIRRGIGFQKTKHLLDRWDAVVTSQRAASHVSFPLSYDASEVGGDDQIPQYRLKTDIDKRLEELRPQTEVIEVGSKDKFPLTMEEIMERRKETAKMRAVESYKEAKARRQNKIKSKKFHRILRHEKIKQQLKEFEQLQKTNPEEALKKLEHIERARVEERMSLRHKGTGKWAKNKQVRAKYDKDTRKVLAQQLTLSRDLTQKIDVNANDDSDEEPNTDMTIQTTNYQENPWVGPLATSSEINDFVSGYRKFWDAKNSSTAQVNEESPMLQAVDTNNECLQQKVVDKNETPIVKKKPTGVNTKKNKQVKNHVITTCGTSNWVVTSAEKVDDIFDNLQSSLEQQLDKKYRKLQADLVPSKKKTKKQKAQRKKKSVTDLSFPKSKSKAIIDEELITNDNSKSSELDRLNSILSKTEVQPTNIDPSTAVKIAQPVNLETEIPDPLTLDENENDNQKDIILEAFEDDDVVDEFQKSKKDVVNKDIPKDINLTLPGWGSWDGYGVPVSKRKNTRFIVKFPKKIPRRDDNKGNLIIYEDSSAKVKSHQVNEVPFPFTKVKDFEASIRAPIGNTFVPELAFRKMIRPAVTTQAGTIIEPLTTDVLLKKKYA